MNTFDFIGGYEYTLPSDLQETEKKRQSEAYAQLTETEKAEIKRIANGVYGSKR